MAVTIITKYSETSGAIPTTLAPGEMAVDINLGRMYYRNTQGEITALAQTVYIVTSGTAGLSGQPGCFRWDTDTQQLRMRAGRDDWTPVALSLSGGSMTGHLDVNIDNFEYFRTGDDIGAAEDGTGGVKGIETAGKLRTGSDIWCGGDLNVLGESTFSDNVLMNGTLNVQGDTGLNGDVIFNSDPRRSTKGGYYCNASAAYTGNTITVSSSSPSNGIGKDGDLWFKV